MKNGSFAEVSERFVEPLDGIVARRICLPMYSHLSPFLSRFRLSLVHLSSASLFSAFISGLMLYLGNPIVGGVLVFITLIVGWLGWRQVERFRVSRFWMVLGSTLDRIGEIFIISGIIVSRFAAGTPRQLIGIFALVGSLIVSYTAVRSGREFRDFVWKGFSAYGATRDVRLTIIATSSILSIPSLGLTVLAILTSTVIVKRIMDVLSLG